MRHARPVLNETDALNVEFGISLQQIIDVVSCAQFALQLKVVDFYSASARNVSKAFRVLHALSRDNTVLPAHPAFHPSAE